MQYLEVIFNLNFVISSTFICLWYNFSNQWLSCFCIVVLLLFWIPFQNLLLLLIYFFSHLIQGKLELDCDLDLDGPVSMPQTPAAPVTRPTRSRRRVRIEEENSDEESLSVVPTTHHTVKSRSERASKTAAINKMSSASRSLKIDEINEQEEDSDVTSDDSDASD